MTTRALFYVETPHRFAGAQKALLEMLRPIAAHGVVPLVVLPAEGIVADAYRDAGLDVRILEAPPRLLVFERGLLGLSPIAKADLAVREILPYAARLAALARRERVDVVHFNQVRGLLLAGPVLRMRGVPIVLHLHGMPNFGSRTAVRLAAASARRIVLCADAIGPALDAPFRGKTVTVHNGLPDVPSHEREGARQALLDALEVDEAERASCDVLVTLATRTAFKGLHHLAAALAAMPARPRPLRWAMLGAEGEASYVGYLARELARLGLDERRVRVLGFRRDAVRLLAGADLLVLPTVAREVLDDGTGPREIALTEGLPMAILEALACGVPVVATDVAGVREQLDDGRTGRIVPPSNPQALAEAIGRVLDDTAMRARVRTLGPEVVRTRFAIDDASAKLAAVLDDACRGGRDA